MTAAFKTLVKFLDQFAGEVEGRSQVDPPDEIRSKLKRFARGELDELERVELIDLLKANPGWVELLAQQARALRSATRRRRRRMI